MLLRTKPRLPYCGLTVVLSNPSGHDTVNLLAGNGGMLFNKHCLQPDYNSMQIDVRLAEDKSPMLEGTKCIIIMGEYACHTLLPETRLNTLGEVRGGIYEYKGIPTIPTFSAQEAADIKNYEDEINTLSKSYSGDDSVSDSGDEEEGDGKRHGKTKRANYAFWIKHDTNKAKRILKHGRIQNGVNPNYKMFPAADEVINILTRTKGQHLYFDIETDYEEQNLSALLLALMGLIFFLSQYWIIAITGVMLATISFFVLFVLLFETI